MDNKAVGENSKVIIGSNKAVIGNSKVATAGNEVGGVNGKASGVNEKAGGASKGWGLLLFLSFVCTDFLNYAIFKNMALLTKVGAFGILRA